MMLVYLGIIPCNSDIMQTQWQPMNFVEFRQLPTPLAQFLLKSTVYPSLLPSLILLYHQHLPLTPSGGNETLYIKCSTRENPSFSPAFLSSCLLHARSMENQLCDKHYAISNGYNITVTQSPDFTLGGRRLTLQHIITSKWAGV